MLEIGLEETVENAVLASQCGGGGGKFRAAAKIGGKE